MDELILNQNLTILDAIKKIDANALGVVFIVADDEKLVGVITDGDIRRSIIEGKSLEDPVREIMTTDYTSLPNTADPALVLSKLGDQINILPLVDNEHKPVDYASKHRLHKIPVSEPDLDGNELKYVTSCIKDNWISSQGSFVHQFENDFSNYIQVPQSLACSSGTTALHLGIAALGIGPGDEVIVPNLTFAASINAIIYTGATPVIVDVESDTWNMCPTALENAITEKTKAVVVVHLYGQPAKMDDISACLKDRKIFLIEDAAQGLGSTYNNQMIGSFGDVSAFSFFGNKLMTTGEGGMVCFQNQAIFEQARLLRDHGMVPSKRYWHEHIGFNYRLTNLQAAVGVAQLERINSFARNKLEIGKLYTEKLNKINGITLPHQRQNCRNVYWLFSILLDSEKLGMSRDETMVALQRAGIETRPTFYPLSKMPPYVQYGDNKEFPVSEKISASVLSLPSAVKITEPEIVYICNFIKNIFGIRKLANEYSTGPILD